MIKCIAIDDEPLSLDIVELFSNKVMGMEFLGAFSDIEKAAEFIRKNKVDLLFLDIQMPDMNGFNFFRTYGKGKMVIFTTAFSEFAFEGFNVQAVDFLVKPFDLSRFEVAVNKVREFIKLKELTGEPEPEYVTIKSDYKFHLVNISDILYVESKDDYVKFILKGNKFLLSKMTTKTTQDMLPDHSFIRIHRSFIVNRHYLSRLSVRNVIVADATLPIGKKYKKEVMNSFLTKG